MILSKYEPAFRELTTAELDRVMVGLAAQHPDLLEIEDLESGDDLLEYCRANHISQAEVIMGMATDISPVAVMAVERLCMRPIDRRSPSQVEREREAASPRPVIASVSSREATTDQRVIRILVEGNPKRAGTSAHDRFARYQDGMTVAQFLSRGGTRGDLSWDQERRFIRIDPEA